MTKYTQTTNVTITNEQARIRGGLMKRLLTTAAVCLALGAGTPGLTEAAAQSAVQNSQAAPEAATALEQAFDTLIGDSKKAMMGDPALALEHATAAENLVRSAADYPDRDRSLATAMWLRSEALYRSGKSETAAVVVSAAMDLVDEATMSTKLGGDLLLAQGRIASRLSDVETAVKSYFKAHQVFVDLDAPRKEAIAMQQIGRIYRDAQAFDKALDYYVRAAEVYEGGASMKLSSANNRANILKDMGRHDEARVLFSEALAIAKDMGSTVLEGRILTNLAELETLAGLYTQAESYADAALAALEGEEGVEWARFAYGAQAHVKLKRGEIDAASALIDKAFDGVDVDSTSMDFEELHDVAYQVSMKRGEYGRALSHHQSFKRLGANFQFAEQELNITRLKNDQLHSDMLLASAQKRQTQQNAVIAVGGVTLLSAFAAAFGFRNHRNRIATANQKLAATVDQRDVEIARREVVERDLIDAKDAAEAANRTKSAFLATMSHELRTPMNGILGFSRILKAGDVNDEQRDQLEIIEQSGEALLGLINDILDLSQIEAGKLKLTNGAFNLKKTVDGVVKLLQPKAAEKDLTLAAHVDPRIASMVDGDGDRVRQVLVNLVGNAVKFTETGSVAVIVKPGEADGQVRIGVLDTGIGIPSEKVCALFERFSQVDNSSTRKYGGSGLGLAICKELVEAMDGDIRVSSILGEGTEVWATVQLPAAEDMTALAPAATELAEPARVLVVDDCRVARAAYAEMLPAMNAEAVAAASAEAAIETLMHARREGERFDAVVVAEQVGRQRGEDVLSAIRRNLLGEGAHMLLKSAQRLDAEELDLMGFDGQISQPLTDASIFAALKSTLEDAVDAAEADETPMQRADNVVSLMRPAKQRRILIVDDVAANSKLIAAVLAPFNHAIDIVEGGAEAVTAAEEKDYDLILMDVFMPGMNGVEATRRIRREDARNAKTSIVALTALAMSGDERRFLDAGMDDYLSKPIDVAELRAKVQQHLGRVSDKKAADMDVALDLDAGTLQA